METPEPHRTIGNTYHITYGIALIIVILILNILALDVITGSSVFSSFFPVPQTPYNSFVTTHSSNLHANPSLQATSSSNVVGSSTPASH